MSGGQWCIGPVVFYVLMFIAIGMNLWGFSQSQTARAGYLEKMREADAELEKYGRMIRELRIRFPLSSAVPEDSEVWPYRSPPPPSPTPPSSQPQSQPPHPPT